TRVPGRKHAGAPFGPAEKGFEMRCLPYIIHNNKTIPVLQFLGKFKRYGCLIGGGQTLPCECGVQRVDSGYQVGILTEGDPQDAVVIHLHDFRIVAQGSCECRFAKSRSSGNRDAYGRTLRASTEQVRLQTQVFRWTLDECSRETWRHK